MIQLLSPSTGHQPAVEIYPEQLRQDIDLRPYRISHALQSHPLLQLESRVALAKRLPTVQREYVFAKQEFGTHE